MKGDVRAALVVPVFLRVSQGLSLLKIVLVVRGASVPNVDVIIAARLAVESASDEGEVVSAGLTVSISARWSCSSSSGTFAVYII